MILITGAATRIGAAIARRLARPDAQIILHYNASHDDAQELAKELRQHGATITLWRQDLRAPDLQEAFKSLTQQTGPVQTLINNAAVFYPVEDKLGNVMLEFWRDVMQVNIWAPMCLMQEMSIELPKHQNGNIINILDQRVLNISHAFPVYTASKSALWSLTQNMARALAPNIRVNAIAPGHVLPTASEAEDKFRARQAKTPLGVGPTPDEIAGLIALILESPSITGVCIPLDGGEHLMPKQK
jgi:NAD(P)-dependent dehydrogenase (short-subunit alcohol dehydrogenase family)